MHHLEALPLARSSAPILHLAPTRPLPFADAEQLFERCLITRQNLAAVCARGFVAHEAEHLRDLRSFVAADPATRGFRRLIDEQQILERAAVVAGEALGTSDHLAPRDLIAHRRTHRAFMLEMLWMWVLDDTLDVAAERARSSTGLLCGLAGRMSAVLRGGVTASTSSPLAADKSRQAELAHCILAVFTAYAQTPEEFRPAGPTCAVMMEEFLASYARVHRPFMSWAEYVAHRSYNSGLWSTTLHTAACFGPRIGVDVRALADLSPEHVALIRRHCFIGALANDLFGLDEDLQHGIGTSFAVERAVTSPRIDDDAVVLRLVARHNERLRELMSCLHADRDPVTRLLLYAALRSAWAVRVLHHEAASVYRATTLHRVLGSSAISTADQPHQSSAPVTTRPGEHARTGCDWAP